MCSSSSLCPVKRNHKDSDMDFWGASIPNGRSFTHRCENPPRRFRITKATLLRRVHSYIANAWSFVECRIGKKTPVYLCSLEGGSIPLEVEFEESEDIIFSVRGRRGVRLSGHYVSHIKSETDSCEVKAARSDEYACRRCKCMETCTNRAMVEKSETDKALVCKHIERDMTTQKQYLVEGKEDNMEDNSAASKIDENLEGHVDSDFVLKEKIKLKKRKGEVIVSTTANKLNDMSVSSTNLHVVNIQKLKKKKRKINQDDVKNIENHCRNRQVIPKEENVKVGKMHGKSTEEQINSRSIVQALPASQARIHKKHVVNDSVLKEQIKLNKGKAKVIVSMIDHKLNDISVSSTDLEVGNVQQHKKKKRKREHKDVKNIDDDHRNRKLVGSEVVSSNIRKEIVKVENIKAEKTHHKSKEEQINKRSVVLALSAPHTRIQKK